MGRFLHAAGIGCGDIVQNCFGYHLTPAGHILEDAARAVDATVNPAGTGQTELQVRAAAHLGAAACARTPDYLGAILEQADALGLALSITKAAVSGGGLFASLRTGYAARAIACLQCNATADLGPIAQGAPSPDGGEPEGIDGAAIDASVREVLELSGTVEIVAPGELPRNGEVIDDQRSYDKQTAEKETPDSCYRGVDRCGSLESSSVRRETAEIAPFCRCFGHCRIFQQPARAG